MRRDGETCEQSNARECVLWSLPGHGAVGRTRAVARHASSVHHSFHSLVHCPSSTWARPSIHVPYNNIVLINSRAINVAFCFCTSRRTILVHRLHLTHTSRRRRRRRIVNLQCCTTTFTRKSQRRLISNRRLIIDIIKSVWMREIDNVLKYLSGWYYTKDNHVRLDEKETDD